MAIVDVNKKFARFTAMLGLVAGTMTAAAACAGGSTPLTAPPTQTAGATTSHTIHVFITQPDGSSRPKTTSR
jgi:hypothetical protein